MEGSLENISSKSFTAEYPLYKRTVFDVFVSEFFGEGAEELEFICLE
jgi:hypothetical protein